MIIIIEHDQHWEWVTLIPGERPQNNERVRRVRPNYARPLEVRRLVRRPGKTVVNIPDERVKAMGKQMGATKHEAIARHLVHAVHDSERAPAESWRSITVDGDEKLSDFLRETHIGGKQ